MNTRPQKLLFIAAAFLVAAAALNFHRGGTAAGKAQPLDAAPSCGVEPPRKVNRQLPARGIRLERPLGNDTSGCDAFTGKVIAASLESDPSAIPSATPTPPGAEAGARLPSRREPPAFQQLRDSKKKPISPRVRQLADEITRDSTNNVGRARAIYDWITENIAYDTEEWEHITSGATEYTHEHDPDSVLDRGSTVCIGYAWLFDDLCEAAGIDATWLIGDVRGYRGTPDDELVSQFRHAWNAVKLDDGEWHLLDATWGANQEGESASLARERKDYYFDTPASQFVYDHLPESAEWQLLEEPVEPTVAFSMLPNLKPTFFTNGLRLDGGYTSELRARSGGNSALFITVPDGVEVAATLGPASGKGEFADIRTVALPDGQGTAAVLPSLSKGSYILRLYSADKGDRVMSCSADFKINVDDF